MRRRRPPVTQIIAVTVKGDSISCSINNKIVATHPRSEVVAAGKLKSTDGHYGLRFGHSTDATVTDFKKIKATIADLRSRRTKLLVNIEIQLEPKPEDYRNGKNVDA